jgi:hypothetical protein
MQISLGSGLAAAGVAVLAAAYVLRPLFSAGRRQAGHVPRGLRWGKKDGGR